MDYTNLGKTGLKVSRICLGCMSYGEPERGNHPWTMGEAASRPFLKKALDLTFFPELWEARTYLSTQHGDTGCPFAKT